MRNLLTTILLAMCTFFLWVFLETQNNKRAVKQALDDAELRNVENFLRSIPPIDAEYRGR